MSLRKKLLIISHTEHYIRDGKIVGWGPTVTEINYLSQYWEEIVHIACLYTKDAPSSSLSYISSNIRFEPISPFGGNAWYEKLGILCKIPRIIATIKKELNQASEVQLRLPTGIGVFLLPYFSLRTGSYNFWVKYAGNWQQESPPFGYWFQRFWLKNNIANCKVTINGTWPDQPKHCISFENPCLHRHELSEGLECVNKKEIVSPYSFIFIGRLEDEKGVDRILEALENLPAVRIKEMHFVGDGPQRIKYAKRASQINIPIHFHGFLPRHKVHELLKLSHFLLLPSDSEGFPKVLAEAACYGVVPVVSSISSIPHYINESNGFLWHTSVPFYKLMENILKISYENLDVKKKNIQLLATKFSFNAYYLKLQQTIF